MDIPRYVAWARARIKEAVSLGDIRVMDDCITAEYHMVKCTADGFCKVCFESD